MAENKLINLVQIEGGLALQQAIQALETYPAERVTTRITKGDESGTTYTAEELLLLLKTTVDTQLGNGSGSVADQITAACKTLQDGIDAINNREVKDRVKVTGAIDAAGTLTLGDTSAVTALDKTIDYIMYYENNKPVRDAEGNNVTYNFETGVMSDKPHVRSVSVIAKTVTKEAVAIPTDKRTFAVANINLKPGTVTLYRESGTEVIPEAEGGDGTATRPTYTAIDESEYYLNTVSGKALFKADQDKAIVADYQYEVSELDFVPLVGAAAVKLFPIGTFKTQDLPKEYLLDNTELNLIAYSEVIDELATGLSRDRELVDNVISLIGTEAVQNALIKITEALQAQIDAIDKKFTNKDIDRQNDLLDVNHRVDEILSISEKTDEFVAAAGQTEFVLSAIPTADKVMLDINGVDYKEGRHFTVDRAATKEEIVTPAVLDVDGVTVITPAVTKTVAAPKLTWTFVTAANGFDLLAGMLVDASYEVKAAVADPVHVEHVQ